MTASDKKKTTLLVGLLVVAGLSWYFVYRPATGAVQTAPPKPAAKTVAPKLGQDAQIRLDIVGKASNEVGRKNLFTYGQKPAPKPPEPARGFSQPTQQQTVFTAATQSSTPVTPPPPPFRSFRYEGFSVSKGGGKILGSITEGGNTYEVKEGECVMGQYCVLRLTEAIIEIEDIQLKQRRSFPRTQ